MQASRGKVPFGLKDGRLVFVHEVPTGLACGCVCPDPACGQPLVACNNPLPSRERAFHFRHAASNPGCGGRESAIHRMAKQLIERAQTLTLPAWSAGELAFPARRAGLAPGSVLEATVAEHGVRSDVRVTAVVGTAVVPQLHVEVKVSHAVDHLKAARVVDGALNMIEIDLSALSDDELADESAFTERVLHDEGNRRWVHLAAPAFIAEVTGREVLQIVSGMAKPKTIPLSKGGLLHVQVQDVLRYLPGEPGPSVLEIELSDTTLDGQRVDRFGNRLPYAPGLYRRGPGGSPAPYGRDFKTHLMPVVPDLPAGAQQALL